MQTSFTREGKKGGESKIYSETMEQGEEKTMETEGLQGLIDEIWDRGFKLVDI